MKDPGHAGPRNGIAHRRRSGGTHYHLGLQMLMLMVARLHLTLMSGLSNRTATKNIQFGSNFSLLGQFLNSASTSGGFTSSNVCV